MLLEWGFVVGPYFKFRTYSDMISNKHVEHVRADAAVAARLTKLPLYLFCYLLGSYYDVKVNQFYYFVVCSVSLPVSCTVVYLRNYVFSLFRLLSMYMQRGFAIIRF